MPSSDTIGKPHPSVDEQGLFRTLVDHMNEMVWVVDQSDATVYVNNKFCEVTGYRMEEVLGKQTSSFLSERGRESVSRVNSTDRAAGKSSSYESELVTRDGRLIPVWISGSPRPDGGSIGIMTDLTELKKTQALNSSVGSSRVDLQACKLEYSIVSPK